MLYSSNHAKWMKKIVPVYIECGVRSFPVDCFSILRHYGFRIFSYTTLKQQNQRLYELCSAYTGDAFRYKDVIAYNEQKLPSRIRFSLMHEFAHYILKHKEDGRDFEEEADEFASNFMAPRILVHRYGYRTADQIHDAFGLSYAASNRVLADYRTWFDIISHTTRQPSDAERQLELMFFPEHASEKVPAVKDTAEEKEDSYRNDYEDMYRLHGDNYLFWMIERQRYSGYP